MLAKVEHILNISEYSFKEQIVHIPQLVSIFKAPDLKVLPFKWVLRARTPMLATCNYPLICKQKAKQ